MTRTRRDPYEVLGVDRQVSDTELKAAYRRLALKYHPDRNPGDATAEEHFKEISEAYATLRDPELKARFDRYGSYSGPQGQTPDFSTVDWQTLFREADIQFSQGQWHTVSGGGNLMFQALFGMMAGLMRQSGLLPGEDREVALELSLEEAQSGATRRVRVPGPSVCPTCRGSGGDCLNCSGAGLLRSGAEVELSVPAGVAQGTRLRLKGLGGPGMPPGDAYVRLAVKLPLGAHLEGRDLHTDVALLPSEAAQGAKAKVHGLTVDIPPGSKDGDELRLPKRGLAGGDLVLRLKVAILPALFRKVRDIFA